MKNMNFSNINLPKQQTIDCNVHVVDYSGHVHIIGYSGHVHIIGYSGHVHIIGYSGHVCNDI